ncbi:MAG TPA: hypothetical protein VL988_03535 [Solirubrobacteraceae bacterium]|nr:hypothetical protein [Solirubrobacteraceae bacterium]
MEIRSYRRVFDLERRIYRIDRLRLNPGGIPLRGLAYYLTLTLLALAGERLPPLSLLAHLLPWYVRELALPCLCAAALALVRVEGRPFHLAARAALRSGVGPRSIVGLSRRGGLAASASSWHPAPLLMLPDGSDRDVRRLDYRGPGALLVGVAHECRVRRGPLIALGLRPRLSLQAREGDGRSSRREVIVIESAARLRVG